MIQATKYNPNTKEDCPCVMMNADAFRTQAEIAGWQKKTVDLLLRGGPPRNGFFFGKYFVTVTA